MRSVSVVTTPLRSKRANPDRKSYVVRSVVKVRGSCGSVESTSLTTRPVIRPMPLSGTSSRTSPVRTAGPSVASTRPIKRKRPVGYRQALSHSTCASPTERSTSPTSRWASTMAGSRLISEARRISTSMDCARVMKGRTRRPHERNTRRTALSMWATTRNLSCRYAVWFANNGRRKFRAHPRLNARQS